MVLKKREVDGIRVLKDNGVRQLSSSAYLVQSQSNRLKWYKVEWNRSRWACDCPDQIRRGKTCKHIHAVWYYMKLKKISSNTENLDVSPSCPKCNSNLHVIKRGWRYNRNEPMRRYHCKQCESRFRADSAFARMRQTAITIAQALDLYYRGLSLRQIADHLKSVAGSEISHGTVYNWIKKYVELINNHFRGLRVATSERWHADDTLVRIRGRHLVFWALLDGETRFLIALHISQGRGAKEAEAFFKKGVKTAKNIPLEIVTDGLQSYSKAIEKQFSPRLNGQGLIHLQGPLTAPLNNNKVERFHGTLKGRTKAMRHLNNEETAKTFAKGFEIYYNFIKPHQSLNGKTPAQATRLASIQNNWLGLISDASKHN